MKKDEIASYLVSLHTLIEAQTKGPVSIASAVLGAEYEKHWGLLKEAIAKDDANEAARQSRPRFEGRHEAGAVGYSSKS